MRGEKWEGEGCGMRSGGVGGGGSEGEGIRRYVKA